MECQKDGELHHHVCFRDVSPCSLALSHFLFSLIVIVIFFGSNFYIMPNPRKYFFRESEFLLGGDHVIFWCLFLVTWNLDCGFHALVICTGLRLLSDA